MKPRKPVDDPHLSSRAVTEQLAQHSLLEALIERRSRRFGHSMNLNGGPLPTTAPAPRRL